MSDEAKTEEKTQLAYMMVQGDSAMQYRLLEVHLQGDRVVDTKELGNPDLKVVVWGRLMRLMATKI